MSQSVRSFIAFVTHISVISAALAVSLFFVHRLMEMPAPTSCVESHDGGSVTMLPIVVGLDDVALMVYSDAGFADAGDAK